MSARSSRSASRKRRHKSLDSGHPSDHSPPSKRRRVSSLPSNSAQKKYHERTLGFLTNNLNKLRNDNKISDVTFVLPLKPMTPSSPSTNHVQSEGTVNASSLSDDEQMATTKTFKCIKALFAANSDVFKAMLYGNMRESRPNAEIVLNDISCRAFEYIRDLFYHFNPVLTSDIVLEVAVAASKYCIDHLITECVNHLRSVSNIDEWFDLIQGVQSQQYHHCFGMEMYLKALVDENYMVNNCGKELLSLSRFFSLNVDTLCRVLRSDNLNCPEEWIWAKCIGFAVHFTKTQCSTQSIPRSIHQLIEAHLNLPKRLLTPQMKRKREAMRSPVGAPKNNKNWDRVLVERRDFFPENKEYRRSGDIVIESDGDDVNLEMDRVSDLEEPDGKEMEPQNAALFESTFKQTMLTLSEHIRFTAMNPLFFIKLVQGSSILPLQRIVAVQNWTLCKVRPKNSDDVNIRTTSRKRLYLRHFERIQSRGILRSGQRKQHRDCRANANGHSLEEEGKSENQPDGECGDGAHGVHFESTEVEPPIHCFHHHEICFGRLRFDRLRVNDHIDHRDNVGRFATAIIVAVDPQRQKVKLHYIGWQSKWDLWCDVSSKDNQIRFCCAGAISTRRLHRAEFRGLDLKDLHVKCRLARYWYHNHPDVDPDGREWRSAQIKRVDKHSGQVQLVVRIGEKDYLWWVHLDSVDEVKPSRAQPFEPGLPEMADMQHFHIPFPPPPPPPPPPGQFAVPSVLQ